MANELKVEFRVDTGPVFAFLRKMKAAVDPAIMGPIIEEEGQIFVKRAVEILESTDYGKNPQVVTGELRDSVKFECVPGGPKGRLKAKFWVDCPYAAAVEFKTPRRQNPPSFGEILAWKMKKIGPREGVEGGIKAWKHIMEHGVQNHPFFWPAYRMMKPIFLWNVRKRVIIAIKEDKIVALASVRALRPKHISILGSFRSQLYRWARILGWIQAAGLDVSGARVFLYGTARGIGNIRAITGATVARRAMRIGAGGVASFGIGMGIPNVDPIAARAGRVVAGKLAGTPLRGMSR